MKHWYENISKWQKIFLYTVSIFLVMVFGIGLIPLALLIYLELGNLTKDLSWDWRRIAKWAFMLPIGLAALVFCGIFLNETYDNYSKDAKEKAEQADRSKQQLTPQTSFYGIALSANPSDVRFLKGEPTKILESDVWAYEVIGNYSKEPIGFYFIRFSDNKVASIFFQANLSNNLTELPAANLLLHSELESQVPSLHFFEIGSDYEKVVNDLGEPSSVSDSTNHLIRKLYYDQYNKYFIFEKGRVTGYGIYQAKYSPVGGVESQASELKK